MEEFFPIIIVDDDQDERQLIIYAFSQIGYKGNIKLLSSGSELISLLDSLEPSNYPNLIILDYNMPSLRGSDTIKRIHENIFLKNIPIIIFSTTISENIKTEMKNDNVLLFIEKGSSADKLKEQARFFVELIDQ